MSRRNPDKTTGAAGDSKQAFKSTDDEEEELEAEMQQIFKMGETRSLSDLYFGDTKTQPDYVRPFTEDDYKAHRIESKKTHQPLHKLTKKLKKRNSQGASQSPSGDEYFPAVSITPEPEEVPTEEDPLLSVSDSPLVQIHSPSRLVSPKVKKDDNVMFYVGSTSSLEPSAAKHHALQAAGMAYNLPRTPSQQRESSSSYAASPEYLLSSYQSSSPERSADEGKPEGARQSKVSFILGDDVRKTASSDGSHMPHHISKHRKHHSVKRMHHGFQIDANHHKNVLEPEEAENLQNADIDNMSSHRFHDFIALRMPKITTDIKRYPSRESMDKTSTKKVYDHQSHELFIELHELKEFDSSDVLEWRETARWIKYEEDVELGPDKWGKPHVPPLSFHSLLKLRHCLESGDVLVDLEKDNLPATCRSIVDKMVSSKQIDIDQKDSVLGTLMLRHRHVNEKLPTAMRRNSSGYGNLNMLGHDKNRSAMFSKKNKKPEDGGQQTDGQAPETVILMPANAAAAAPTADTAKRKDETKSNEQIGIQRRVPGTAEGCAVLVGELEDLQHPATVFVRLAEAKKMPNFLEIPIDVRFLFVLLGPPQLDLDYHEVGRAFGALMSNEDFRTAAYKASERIHMLRAINHFLERSTVVPPGKWENKSLLPLDEIRRKSLVPPRRIKEEPVKEEPDKPLYDPLERTGWIFGGFWRDIKHRYPLYRSDILDGLNFQCLASIIFIYFAAVSGAIAFGGLLSDKTGSEIGVTETLLGTSICGILFSLFSGQPLIIIGTTAPLVLVDETLYKFRESFSDFLVVRSWVGIWCAVISAVVVAAEGSMLVKYFSRFVQEVFATIISLIFIAEAVQKLYKIFLKHPLMPLYCNETTLADLVNDTLEYGTKPAEHYYPRDSPRPNAALFSVILMLGTFYIAFSLRHFRNSKFLVGKARRALGDFGVPIALVIMVTLDYFAPYAFTEKLVVPPGFSPSKPRPWFVSPFPTTSAEVAVGFVGGVLVFILMFLETQICELIISKKSISKGSGFHLDMVMVGLMAMASGLIGGPWQCAATVRSITHTSSLIVWSKTHAPGETPHIVEVKEQRLTNLVVSLLVGLSIMMSSLLRQVPFAVLFGVFLYMGISALSGIHLCERFLLLFMHPKNHPDNFNFVRKVRLKQMHIYTFIQLVCIALIWLMKTFVPLAFPLGLLSLPFVHWAIKKDFLNLFHPDEIKALDEEDEERNEDEEEPDFYEQIVA